MDGIKVPLANRQIDAAGRGFSALRSYDLLLGADTLCAFRGIVADWIAMSTKHAQPTEVWTTNCPSDRSKMLKIIYII